MLLIAEALRAGDPGAPACEHVAQQHHVVLFSSSSQVAFVVVAQSLHNRMGY